MHHPEVDQRNPSGYHVSWSAFNSPVSSSTPWLKIIAVCFGCSLVCFSGGYFLAANQTAGQLKEAEALKGEAEYIKSTASSDLNIARAKVAEQQQRLRIVNDCVYAALNEPVPTPVPSPAN